MAYATNSLGNYSGTIISSPIRPFGPNELLATVFSNEIKGGHHNYETLTERDNLFEVRRDWGMLVTIYNDSNPINNKTYKLEYNFSSTSITDNNNWIEYNPSGLSSNLNTEWVNSCDEIALFPVGSEPDGYRYLILGTGSFGFLGEDNKIAQWNSISGSFSFFEPTNGTTLRVDTTPNILYRYSGTYSSGVWVTEVLNSVRYLDATSIDGLTYSAISTHAPVNNLYDSIYYVNFGVTSSGTVSLSIDGLTASSVLKLENNVLNNVVGNDLIPGIRYQLIWNGTGFQTTLPSSSTTTIGPAEDGNYTDGVFTDFVPSTPIGTAVDRFNEFFLNLLPLQAATLSSWTANGSFVNGGLSFDNTTSGSLFTATSSPYGSVSSGETFSSLDSYYRLGITSKFLQPITGTQFYSDISGILNIDVNADPYSSFTTYSFGFASTGTISMFLNGVTVSEIGLTGGAVDTTLSGATSGLNISAPTASKFINGNYYENYQNRTGTYLIKSDSSDIVDGYNYFIVQHQTDSNNYVLSQFEFVSDSSTTDVSVLNPNISNIITTSNRKWLSGIAFYTTPTQFIYNGLIQNAFLNTFNQDDDAVSYLELSNQVSSLTNSVTNTVTNGYTSSVTTPSILFSNLIPDTTFDPTSTMTINMTYSLNSGVRRIDDSIGFGLQVKRTVQGTFIGGTSTSISNPTDNWFIDSVLPSSSTFSENFDDENYRLQNGATKFGTYNLTSEFAGATWSSLASLLQDPNHFNGLQVINGLLIYPNFNFSNNGPGSTVSNPNFGVGLARNYQNCFSVNSGFGTSSSAPLTNNRTYTRWFYFGNPGDPLNNYNRGIIRLTYENTNFINADIPIVGNTNAWLEVKLPYDSGIVPGGTVSGGAVTGWLDATKPFTGTYEDGDGCLSGTQPTISGSDWLIDFGVKGTLFSGGYVLLRITAGQDWIGNITNITFIPD